MFFTFTIVVIIMYFVKTVLVNRIENTTHILKKADFKFIKNIVG